MLVFVEDFCIHVHSDTDLSVVCVISLTLQSDGGLIERIHNYSFFYNFLELKFKLLKVYLANMLQVYTYIHTQHKNIC